MQVVTASQMRQVDLRAREEFGIPEVILMEHAGHAVAKEALRWFRKTPFRSGGVLVLSGGGANGGDGFVAARHLDNWGIPVKVVLLADPQQVRGAALVNLQILRRLKVPLSVVSSPRSFRSWAQKRHRVRVVIDALLGTGFSGNLREPIQSAIRWLNRKKVPIVSVDIPSGLSADTGQACPFAVRATVTVTCGLKKVGLTRGEGPRSCGRIVVADISLPRVLRLKRWEPSSDSF